MDEDVRKYLCSNFHRDIRSLLLLLLLLVGEMKIINEIESSVILL